MRVFIFYIFFFLIASTRLQAQGSYPGGTFEKVRSYTTYKATQLLQIDGLALEQDWEAAPWSEPFVDIEGHKVPKYKTRMKMLWDTDHLYVYAQLEEPHIWGDLKQRDTVIFYNNDFEIFIDPDGDTHNYIEFEVNVLNTVWDLFLTAPYRNNPKVLNQFNLQGLQSAVHVEGTLNNPLDQDRFWAVEVAIPWKALQEASSGRVPPVGEFWRMGFSRVHWDYELQGQKYSRKRNAKGTYLPEYNWVWSAQGVINMHEPEKWGYVYFSENTPMNKTEFEIPKQEALKWFMYEQYRKLLAAYKNNTPLAAVSWQPQGVLFGKEVNLKLTPIPNGFILSAESPFTHEILQINTSGKFSTYDNP